MRRLAPALALGSLLLALGCGDDAATTQGTSSSGDGGSSPSTSASTGASGGSSGDGGDTTSQGGGSSSSQGGGAASAQGGAGQGGGSSGQGGDAPLDGYGALSGACGAIDLEDVLSPQPQLVENTLDFALEGALVTSDLSPGGQTMLAAGNLGGSSLYSEIFAFEALHRCDGAVLVKTESEITYATMSKKTDILVAIDGTKVGVSVVRAMSYPEGAPYPTTQAKSVIEGKLADILLSSASVAPADAWEKQILAVLAQTPDHAAAVAEAWGQIDPAVRADTIVFVTVTEGPDQFIYYGM
jgi:hypothetical protein